MPYFFLMNELLPTYQLQAFCSPQAEAAGVYFPDYTAARPKIPLHRPYRGDYYKISLCLRGRAELKANLTPHVVGPGCLVLATPDVIKQWLSVSEDYETMSVFFTQDFITTHNGATGGLRFLVSPTTYVLQLADADAATSDRQGRGEAPTGRDRRVKRHEDGPGEPRGRPRCGARHRGPAAAAAA